MSCCAKISGMLDWSKELHACRDVQLQAGLCALRSGIQLVCQEKLPQLQGSCTFMQ